ncbi:MAG: DNA primase [Gammaproteobacteria bacterium]|nr:MAG: DNA primase [Gammaproteobacteria bacterium]
MGRIADTLIEQIKTEVSLVRLAEVGGYQPRKQGKDYALSCPFHADDDTPSLIISPATNLFNCFGCDAGGSVIDWVMQTRNLSFRAAAETLHDDYLSLAANGAMSRPANPAPPSPLAADLASRKDDQALLQRVIAFYHQTLKESPEALDYLQKRGLDDPELIDSFKLGYANRTLGPTLPDKNRKAGADIRSQLQRSGLYRVSGHEHFNGSLVIPVMDDNGLVSEVYGRKLLDNLRKGTPKHLYLPGPHAGVFNPGCFVHPEIILCESLIDALTFWRWGFKHVTCSYGTGGFTDALLAAFTQSQPERVLIAYDRDDAGNRAAEAVAAPLLGLGIDCYRVLFPKGMDANDYAQKMSPPRKSLELVLRKAQWLGQGEAPAALEPLLPLAADPVEPAIPASPQPEAPSPGLDAQVTENDVVMHCGGQDGRRYRVRGFSNALSYEQLKINLCVSRDEQLHVDQLDLYHARQRASFIQQAAIELGVPDTVIKQDLTQVLLTLERLQDEQIQAAVAPKAQKTVELTNEEQQAALSLLRDPALLDRLLDDFDRAGVVGEATNKLVGYLAAVSRKLDNPLAVIIQSTSAAGKSALMNAVLAMMPEEERIQYSAMTGQSLFYMGETDLKHKILALAEEEGANQASYALKLLQSEGELTIASTGKDANGNLTTQEYRVEGPVMLFSTTTAIDIDEELMNRCLVLTVNESRAQTQLIHQMQRRKRTLAGLEGKAARQHILENHRNAQRLLRSLPVVNPYADQLTFLDDKTRMRRDHEKYLSLIDTVALLHQYQREVKQTTFTGETIEYIEVTRSDIEIANRLAHEVLGRTLCELPPQTRNLLGQITRMVAETAQQQGFEKNAARFSRRDIREATHWSDNQLKVHCRRLEELEYLLIHRGSRGKSLEYELLFAGDLDTDQPQLMGLIDTSTLKKQPYDPDKLGVSPPLLVPGCPQVGAKLAPSGTQENPCSPAMTAPDGDYPPNAGKRSTGPTKSAASYRTHTPPALAAQG